MVVSSCDCLHGVFSSKVVQNLQNLDQLEVRDCKALKTVFDLEGLEIKEKDDATATLLSCLEKMELNSLPMLAYVWKPHPNILAFQNLKVLQVLRCDRLKYVFPLFMVEGLVKLEFMFIRYCPGLEDIFARNEEHGNGETTNKIVIPQVKTLHLTNLLKLRTFCPVPCTVDCPSLKTLALTHCPDMKTFVSPVGATGSDPIHLFGEKVEFPVLESLELGHMHHFTEIWKNKLPPNSFCELRDLDVSNCLELLHLVPMFMQHRLQKLEKLNVRNCRFLKGIFEFKELTANEGEAVTISQSGETPSISQPEQMQINQIDYRQTQGFPNLTSIKISDCNSLRYLCSPSIATGLAKLKNLSISKCLKMEEIILADGQETEDKVVFPVLETLEIHHMGNFKEICSKQFSPNSFCELRILKVSYCDTLVRLVPVYMQNGFQKLEILNVQHCSLLEEIFESSGLTDNEKHAVIISQMQPHQGFQNLTSLEIYGCYRLTILLSPSIARGLKKLKTLDVSSCEKMEEIVPKEVDETENRNTLPGKQKKTENGSILPQLSSLKLQYLPNLISFSQGKYALEWPLMEEILIRMCVNMKKFCLGSLRTPREVTLSISEYTDKNLRQELNNSRKQS